MYNKFPWREVDQLLNSPREFVLRPAVVLGTCAPAPVTFRLMVVGVVDR